MPPPLLLTVAALGPLGSALAAELPPGPPEPLPPPVPPALPAVARHPLTFGLGATALSSSSPAGLRAGPALDLRHETPLAPRLGLGVTWTLGLTTFENTAAVAGWALDHGAWTTDAFRAVGAWYARPADPTIQSLKLMGAFFAGFGLTLSYALVPIALVVSPVASIGHVSLAPTISFHSSERNPNVYVEGGVGFLTYGHPAGLGPRFGMGPALGVGAQVGHQTFGLRVVISPPGLNDGDRDTVIEPTFVFGF